MIVLAVDGGNSKTDVALVGDDGTVLAHARGPLSSPHHLGLDGCRRGARSASSTKRASTAAAPTSRRCCSPASTSPTRRSGCTTAVAARGWAARIRVGNDTFAVLRAGTERGWGVAVTCGAGINCVGVAPDGRARSLPGARRDHRRLGRRLRRRPGRPLGARRGARTAAGRRRALEQLVPEHFGFRTPLELARAIHAGERVACDACVELAPARARGVATTPSRVRDRRPARRRGRRARASRDRRGSTSSTTSVEVVLGGGLMRRADGAAARPDRARARRARRRRSSCSGRAQPPDRRRGAARARRARRGDRRAGAAAHRASGAAVERLETAEVVLMADGSRSTRRRGSIDGTDAPAVDALDLDDRRR